LKPTFAVCPGGELRGKEDRILQAGGVREQPLRDVQVPLRYLIQMIFGELRSVSVRRLELE
jgi:hypothetical protein